MRKIETTILEPNDARLLRLIQWAMRADVGLPTSFGEFVHKAIKGDISVTRTHLLEDELESEAFEVEKMCIWETLPENKLAQIYEGYWRDFMDSWLQGGWDQLFHNPVDDHINGIIEIIENGVQNHDIPKRDISYEDHIPLITEFLSQWQDAAFERLMIFLTA